MATIGEALAAVAAIVATEAATMTAAAMVVATGEVSREHTTL
jgi:hypothetical protein